MQLDKLCHFYLLDTYKEQHISKWAIWLNFIYLQDVPIRTPIYIILFYFWEIKREHWQGTLRRDFVSFKIRFKMF